MYYNYRYFSTFIEAINISGGKVSLHASLYSTWTPNFLLYEILIAAEMIEEPICYRPSDVCQMTLRWCEICITWQMSARLIVEFFEWMQCNAWDKSEASSDALLNFSFVNALLYCEMFFLLPTGAVSLHLKGMYNTTAGNKTVINFSHAYWHVQQTKKFNQAPKDLYSLLQFLIWTQRGMDGEASVSFGFKPLVMGPGLYRVNFKIFTSSYQVFKQIIFYCNCEPEKI